uniref:Uncharacterized protein n=1 Tax=viral metagenome TaxID=1070528 RepID=A0A6M3IUS2_9ZZZZ
MKYLLIVTVLISSLWGGAVLAADNSIAIYQEYDGTWYEFRYDWEGMLLDWESVDELKAWLEYDDAPLILIANKDGVVSFNGQCEDTAFEARNRAYEIGKWLDTEILSRAESIKYRQHISGDVYSLGVNDGHYLNKAVIDNEVWFVQADTDTIWLGYYLD